VSEARPDDAHQDSHQERHQGGGYRRIELITGEARRRPWSAEEKARILAESFQPGGACQHSCRSVPVTSI